METAVTDPILEAYGECTPQYLLRNKMMRERILRHLDMLNGIFEICFANYENVSLNLYVLRETIEYCLCDLYRLKIFRGIHHEDRHKRASFLMVWIAKMKPIQFKSGIHPQQVHASDLYLNALFALFAGLSILEIPPDHLLEFRREYVSNMVYLLHSHSCLPEQLASELFLLETLFTLLNKN
jgi:hypothetical protein